MSSGPSPTATHPTVFPVSPSKSAFSKIRRSRIASAQFPSLEQLAISNHAACAIEFARCLARSFDYPLAVSVHLWNNTATIAIPIALEQRRDLLHAAASNLQHTQLPRSGTGADRIAAPTA